MTKTLGCPRYRWVRGDLHSPFDRSELLVRAGARCLNLFLAADVSTSRDGATAGSANVGNNPLGSIRATDVVDDDGGTRFGEAAGNRFADAGVGTRHDRALASSVVCRMFVSCMRTLRRSAHSSPTPESPYRQTRRRRTAHNVGDRSM